ncbi:MAG TPA: transglutaminase-like domain-containing protein [Candidatus Acidoferrales bacterium]|nr:transglutaminase-like domain-containing protein [Candidatus Acidoferrales bacterium]
MSNPSSDVPRPANLKPTAILDIDHREVRALAESLIQPNQTNQILLRRAYLQILQTVRPIYGVNEWQPVSQTLCNKQGSCSQRMACLEAVARACGIPTRVRALHVKGSFWFPRFRIVRWFIPRRILLVWPQFFLQGLWVDFDELYSPLAELAATAPQGFRNDGESLFEAVQNTPVDFLGKTCGLACARPEHNLSKFVLQDSGFFDTRDEAFIRFGSFQHTWRGRIFEAVFGGRKSS